MSVVGKHLLNSTQLPSNVKPRAVNGTTLHPVGRLPVVLTLGDLQYNDEFHIYPDVTGTVLSWKTARDLNILPACYPYPPQQAPVPPTKVSQQVMELSRPATNHDIRTDYPEVFNKIMEGAKLRMLNHSVFTHHERFHSCTGTSSSYCRAKALLHADRVLCTYCRHAEEGH